MSPKVIGQRYAQALFELSERQQMLDQIATEIEALLALYQESRLLRAILTSPLYPGQRKLGWLRPVLEASLSPLLWNFIVLLLRRSRESLLSETCQAFLELYDQYKGRLRATVRMAQPLTSELAQALSQKLKQAFQAQEAILSESLEPALMGGFVLEVGTRSVDLSVRGQLNQIRKQLTQVSV